jgi:hypothetical protein
MKHKKLGITQNRGRLQRLVRPVDVTWKYDRSVKAAAMMLNELSSSKCFSKKFLRSLAQLFLGSVEIEDIGLPARGTTVFLGVFAPQRYIKLFSALVAANRLCDREVPFHRSNEKEISCGKVSWQGCSRSLYQGPLASSIG